MKITYDYTAAATTYATFANPTVKRTLTLAEIKQLLAKYTK